VPDADIGPGGSFPRSHRARTVDSSAAYGKGSSGDRKEDESCGGGRAALLAAVVAIAVTGCGGSGEGLSPAAEPARSPTPERRPAGTVLRIGNKPEGLAFHARTGLLAVGLRDPDELAILRGERVAARIPLPAAPRHLQPAGRGGPVLVPTETANALVEVSLPGGRTRTVRVGRQPHDAAAAGRRVFVGNERGHTVSVVEGGREVRRLEAPVGPGGVAALPKPGLVAVVGVRERELELFDVRTLRSAGRIPVGIGPTHVVARGRRLFVVDTRGDGLIELHLDPLRVHRRTHLAGAPYGIAYDRVRRRFWVTLTETNQVAEATDRRLLRTFPTVRQPNSVAVDPRSGRVYVASRSEGTLQIFEPPPYRG
jgi:DNA-binding beta-propeller fold protein YncE